MSGVDKWHHKQQSEYIFNKMYRATEIILLPECIIYGRKTRWCSGQTTCVSPLRFRVQSPVRFILMWTRIQSSCEKSYSQRSAESRGFSPGTPVPPTGISE